MRDSPKSARKAASPAAGTSLHQRLNPAMACDTAFRIIARHCLADLAANQPATCEGDPAALHRMRIALTRLRTAIVFFSPMVADRQLTANTARTEMAEYAPWQWCAISTLPSNGCLPQAMANDRHCNAGRETIMHGSRARSVRQDIGGSSTARPHGSRMGHGRPPGANGPRKSAPSRSPPIATTNWRAGSTNS